MIAYDPAEWHDLFVAIAGATAALAGLLFIAISINLGEIVRSKVLPLRAVDSLGVMVVALLVSIFILTPGQSRTALGLELLVTGLLACVVLLRPWLARIGAPKENPQEQRVLPVISVACSLVPIAIAGLTLLLEAGGGLYWLVPSLIVGFLVAVSSAWVLLLEIHR